MALNGVTAHVFGMDTHPVAVTFARVRLPPFQTEQSFPWNVVRHSPSSASGVSGRRRAKLRHDHPHRVAVGLEQAQWCAPVQTS
jgi:hypothetical protein